MMMMKKCNGGKKEGMKANMDGEEQESVPKAKMGKGNKGKDNKGEYADEDEDEMDADKSGDKKPSKGNKGDMCVREDGTDMESMDEAKTAATKMLQNTFMSGGENDAEMTQE